MGRASVDVLIVCALLGCKGDAGVRQELMRTQDELTECRSQLALARGEATPNEDGEAAPAPETGPAEAEPPPSAEPAPIEVRDSRVRTNSAGTSELSIVVRNVSRKRIDSFRFSAETYNNFNERIVCRLERLRGPVACAAYQGISEDVLAPGQTRTLGTWSMFDFDTATKAIVTIDSVHFTDNSTWEGIARQLTDPREARD